MVSMDSLSPAPAGALPAGYWFAGFRLKADGTLLRGETPVDLSPQELAALRLLLARAGEIVTPLELRHTIWGEAHVSSDSVSRCIASLRERLQPLDCIQSVYKRGHRIGVAVQMDGWRQAGSLPQLAIMPFAVGYSVPEYLGFAVTEQIMDMLSDDRPAIASIVARNSIFDLAKRELSASEIGKILQADLVLTGTLYAMPGHDRLRVEMIRVEDAEQLWVEEFLARHGRIAELSSELVSRLTCRLQGDNPAISAMVAPPVEHKAFPRQSEAYELFLRAHYDWQTLERHRMQDGMGRLMQAIELDPSLLAARIDLARLCVFQTIFGFMSPMSAASTVHVAAEPIPNLCGQATALLPTLGWVSFSVDHNLPEALQTFARAAHLPYNVWLAFLRSMFSLSRHRFAEAIDQLRDAIHIDPYLPWLQAQLSWALHLAGEAEASAAQIRKAIDMFPGHDGVSLYAATILAYNGETEHAVKLAETVAARSPEFDFATSVHAYALACAGRAEEARALLERLQWFGRERFVLNAFNSAAYVALGEYDAALAELRTSLENRCPWFFQMLADPRLKPLAGRKEFEEMRSILAAMEAAAEESAIPEDRLP